MELITVSGLTMQFGNHRALDNVDFTVHSGVTGLVGANGAGKTTFMSIALGLRKPTQGTIRVLALEPITRSNYGRSYHTGLNEIFSQMKCRQLTLSSLAEVENTEKKQKLEQATCCGSSA